MWNPLADLTPEQRDLLDRYEAELARVNRRVNLVSPSTIEAFQTTHVLHSLAIAGKEFPGGATVVDFGSGGGLPAVPLAIRFPAVRFVAVDSSRKKTEAIRLFARRLGLNNLTVWCGRAEEYAHLSRRSEAKPDYAVSRATAPLVELWRWFERVQDEQPRVPDDCWNPGLLTLKGGDLREEIADLGDAFPGLFLQQYPLDAWFGEAFQEKELLHVTSAEYNVDSGQ